MPVLSNARHEKFAQLLAQLHGEMTVADAHEQAGYRRNEGNASTLARHPDVQERVKEIKGHVAAAQQITREKLVEWHNEVRQQGMVNGQLSAADTAIKEISVLTGHRIERAEIGGPGEFDHLTDAELLSAIRERFARLESEMQSAIPVKSIALNGDSHDE
jgi:hypothetical protein